MGVSKNSGKNPNMDGENNGSKPLWTNGWFGGNKTHYFREHPYILDAPPKDFEIQIWSNKIETSDLMLQMNHPFWGTPPKINIEPENDGLEDVSPFPRVYSQVPC